MTATVPRLVEGSDLKTTLLPQRHDLALHLAQSRVPSCSLCSLSGYLVSSKGASRSPRRSSSVSSSMLTW